MALSLVWVSATRQIQNKLKLKVMKKSILSLACLLMAFIGSARADDHITGVSQKVQRSFNEKFVGAREISWTKEGEFNRASFNFNNQVLYAYFEADGTLVATARNILSDKLPLNLLFSLHREYSDYWISNLVE